MEKKETMYIVKDISHYCNVSVPSSYIPKRTIQYYDFSFITKGEMTYFANGQRLELHENDAILLPPGTLRERLAGTQRVDFISFNFTILPECELNTPLFMKNVITQDIKRLVNTYPQRRLSTLYYSKEKLCGILNYILFEILESLSFESSNPDIIQIIKFIDQNIHTKITLTMLSDHVHLSEEYISYIFKKNIEKTVIEYINEHKMILAKQMIEEGTLSLKEISESLGFEHYGYFSRVFKNQFHIPPSRLLYECKNRSN